MSVYRFASARHFRNHEAHPLLCLVSFTYNVSNSSRLQHESVLNFFGWIILRYMEPTNFAYPFINWKIVGLHSVLTIMNNVAMNTCVQVSCEHMPLGYIHRCTMETECLTLTVLQRRCTIFDYTNNVKLQTKCQANLSRSVWKGSAPGTAIKVVAGIPHASLRQRFIS
jgi:hypothetical protein